MAKTTTFPGQHEDEEVLMVFRQHPLVMRKELVIGLLIMLVAVLPLLFWPLSPVAMKVAIFLPLAVIPYWFYRWLGWYYSVYIVSSERIVEVKQKGLFNRKVTEFGLDKVQNINYHIKGLQAVMFKFGDITIQTYVGDLVMRMIYKPVPIHSKLIGIVRKVQADSPFEP